MAKSGLRVGLGIDVHRLGGSPPLLLAGVEVDDAQGLEGTSDGDVLCHAIADALLGAAGLGDLGTFFPPEDAQWKGVAGLDLLGRAVRLVAEQGWSLANVDAVLVAQSVRVMPYREAIRNKLAPVLGVEVGAVSVKATTTDRLGALGRGEGMAAYAVVLLVG